MRQYLCWNKATRAYYIALSVFDDVLDATYSKPIYVEKTPGTAALQGRCENRRFLNREFYSLIKTPEGLYRFNADIYQDARSVLGLTADETPLLGFRLVRLPQSEIKSEFCPQTSYIAARNVNSIVHLAVSSFLDNIIFPETGLGLIGSMGIDPNAAGLSQRDLDFVFCGSLYEITRAYNWVKSKHLPGQPLRRALPSPLPVVCAFFEAEPPVYPPLSQLKILAQTLANFDVIIQEPVSPTFLNIQIYSARIVKSGS